MFKYFTLFLIAISLNAHSAVQNNQLPSTVSKYFPCESFGMSPKAGTSQNKTAFQKCLANYSNISITTPGTYKAVWGNIIKSNQTLYIGSGVTLQQASGVIAASFLSNGNYLSKAVTTTYNITHSFVSGISTATLIFSGGVLPINAETGKTVTVGDYVEITQDKSNQYNGVFRLTAVNNTNKAGKLPAWSLQFAANGNGSDAGVDGLRVAAADANITVTGG